MRYLLTTIFLLQYLFLNAEDTTSCSCITSFKITYPKKAEQNKISGTVIIEWNVSSNGFWSDPAIIKSLGYGCDEEAIRAVKSMIKSNNLCREKCKAKNGKESKLSQTFTFHYTDD